MGQARVPLCWVGYLLCLLRGLGRIRSSLNIVLQSFTAVGYRISFHFVISYHFICCYPFLFPLFLFLFILRLLAPASDASRTLPYYVVIIDAMWGRV